MNEWQEVYNEQFGLTEYRRMEEFAGVESIVWHFDGGEREPAEWVLWFPDPNKGLYNGVGLGEHATPELALRAAEGAIEQARASAMSTHFVRLPLPHQRLQITHHGDGGGWRVEAFDHRITDALYGDGIAENMDCRLGRTPSREQLDDLMTRVGMPPIADEFTEPEIGGSEIDL